MILEWTTYKHVSARKKLDRLISMAIIRKIVKEPSDLVLEEFYLLEKIQIPFFYRCVIITCSLVLTTIIKLQGTYQICSCGSYWKPRILTVFREKHCATIAYFYLIS